MAAFPLLTTKLNLPPRRPGLVSRPRLLEQLERSLLPGNRLALLSAPAGSGKSSLVADWGSTLVQRGIPLAWLSLDEGDNDLGRFMRYLVGALIKIRPEIGQAALAMLDLPQRPPLESLMVSLINELGEAPGDLALVLDDYQVISAVDVQEAVGYLLDHQPSRFHLVITTRVDPSLPLARLRARGEVIEVRATDLRFTHEESAEFIGRSARLSLTPAQAAALDRHTEGWIAGLQMAAIALQSVQARGGGPDALDEVLSSFSGANLYVFDYLAQEVLQWQNAEVSEFLTKTAVLERFTPGLCDALTGRNDSERIIRNLDQSNLFILPLDERRQWFRYYRPFAETLRARLDAPRKAELYRRASACFEHNGLVEEAVNYAIQAQDWPAAARLIRDTINALFTAGDLSTINTWFSALPEEVIFNDPDLCIYQGWSILITNRLELASRLAARAEAILGDQVSATNRGRLLGLQAYLVYAGGDAALAVRLGEEAIGLLNPEDSFFSTTIFSLIGQIQSQSGSVVEAIRAYEGAIRAAEVRAGHEPHPVNTGLVILQANLGVCYYLHGERRRAENYCREAIRRCTDARGQYVPAAMFILPALGEICFQGNDLAEARRYFDQALDICQKMGTSLTYFGGAGILAMLYLLEGDVVGALERIRVTREEASRRGLPWIASQAAAVESWIELKAGNLGAMNAWVQSYLAGEMLPGPLHLERLQYARYLIMTGRFDEALGVLEPIQRQVADGERLFLLTEIEILLARAQAGLGNQAAALQILERAARRAAPEGSLRIFLNDDVALLAEKVQARLNRRSDELLAAFLDQVLALAPYEPGSTFTPAAVVSRAASIKPAGLVEPISPRELDVLRLMARGLTNAAIARELYLSINTLKSHTNSIYGKLDVHSRLQAVNRARELGLIEPG